MSPSEEHDRPFDNAKQLVERILATRFFAGAQAVIPAIWRPSRAAHPLVVVVGENASGKSFFRRCVYEMSRRSKIECLHISMEGRTAGYNMLRSFIYGAEDYEATVINSIRTVLSGIKTSQSREVAHTLVWDEPDLGLSEGNAASVGARIAMLADEPPKQLRAALVMTHRKALVQALIAASPTPPHYLYLGDASGAPDVHTWLAAPPILRPLEEVVRAGADRFQAIQRLLDRNKKKLR